MKNKSKLLSVILTLAMVVSLLPAVTLPISAAEPESTPFYVGNAMHYASAYDSLSPMIT
jgi:hypothetical protein